ncbi:MAG: hypothetical protein KDK00_06340 [Rhodobacteraceae bacterium]|nr:hypothetical protein [Paracoccaceae bacterium]
MRIAGFGDPVVVRGPDFILRDQSIGRLVDWSIGRLVDWSIGRRIRRMIRQVQVFIAEIVV